eukprot:scaffold3809_cov91-Skeletonema_dohrnii-CCMP3373.AAC.4
MFTFQQYDQNDDFLFITSAGNAGDDGGLDVPKTVGGPATSKNGIGVGATVSWGSSLPNRGYGPSFVAKFSSRGPTADGRIKPDLMAPGYWMRSAGARPDEQEECDSDLVYKAGTSMATPVVSGTAAKIRQYFREGYYPSGTKNSNDALNPSGGLIKAVLLNGAQALLGVDNVDAGGGVTPSAPYDNNQGFGRLSLQDSVYLAGKTNVQLKIWDRESVPNRVTNTYDVTIDKSGGCQANDLSVTLVWMEEGSVSGCTACVLHDIDLSVSFRGTTYYPNGRSSPDRTNNSERVVINGVQDGETATISVNAHNIAKSDQTYALVATACFNGVANTLVGTNVFGLQSAAPSTSLSPSDSSMPSASPSTSAEPSSNPSSSGQPSSSSEPSSCWSGPQTASYDKSLGVPKCSFGSSCDSGVILNGRGTMNGGNEPNQPNTLNSCTDGREGTYHIDESIDRIVVTRASDGGEDDCDLTEGDNVTITATVWCWEGLEGSDFIDFYYASDALSPVWTKIGNRQKCPGEGEQNMTASYTLPQGSIQAVRANMMLTSKTPTAANCTNGSYDDTDDLVITVTPLPSSKPSSLPSASPSTSGEPSSQPSLTPSQSAEPSSSSEPSSKPSLHPFSSGQPSSWPIASSWPSASPSTSDEPSSQPSSQPSLTPSSEPSLNPTSTSSGQPSLQPSESAAPSSSLQPSVSVSPSQSKKSKQAKTFGKSSKARMQATFI